MIEIESIPTDDRGLHYGDGLFETLRCVDGQAPFWDWHMQRLRFGCERLALPLPDFDMMRVQVHASAARFVQALVKIIWTAGGGPRGYARPAVMTPRVRVQVQPLRIGDGTDLKLRWCDLKLALQPRLAGVKHLNRLEQVLARSEWSSNEFDEGLMLDSLNRVVCATAANVFVRVGGQWHTPPLDGCGVAGIGRRWMLERGALVRELGVTDIERAEQCVLTNAVRGPRAALSLAARCYQPDASVRALQVAWEQRFARVQPPRPWPLDAPSQSATGAI